MTSEEINKHGKHGRSHRHAKTKTILEHLGPHPSKNRKNTVLRQKKWRSAKKYQVDFCSLDGTGVTVQIRTDIVFVVVIAHFIRFYFKVPYVVQAALTYRIHILSFVFDEGGTTEMVDLVRVVKFTRRNNAFKNNFHKPFVTTRIFELLINFSKIICVY